MWLHGIRSPLFIDKISLTLDIPMSIHKEVENRLKGLVIEELIEGVDSRFSNLTKSFKLAYIIPFGKDDFCAVQICPRKANNRFMRLEWNPTSAARQCVDPTGRIINCLSQCIPSFDIGTILAAKVTRIDITFDLLRVPVDSLSIHQNILRKSITGRYYYPHEIYGAKGQLNAIELGKPDGDRFLQIYDKNLQAQPRQIRGLATPNERANGSPRIRRIKAPKTRFELRLDPGLRLEQIEFMENPFEVYTVTTYTNCGQIRNDHLWQFFVDSCKLRGTHAALSQIPNRRERKKYSDAVKEANPPIWWNPQEIWSEFPNALLQMFGTHEHSMPSPSKVDDVPEIFRPLQRAPRLRRELRP